MLLTRLDIQNFRVFNGAHTIDFATEPGKSVTVFHGENGAGKTTIVNAIHWCLTEDFTPSFKNKDIWINKDAFEAGERECFVELSFDHKGISYRLRRGIVDARSVLTLVQVVDGNTELVPGNPNPNKFIEKIIPKDLVKWFFFDAEAIGAFELSGSGKFKRDLRETFGFSIVDKLLTDLEGCLSAKNKEVTSATNDKNLKAIQSNIESIENALPSLQSRQSSLDQEIHEVQILQASNEKKLGQQPQIRELQKTRLIYERNKSNYQKEKEALQKRIVTLVGASAAPLFAKVNAVKLANDLEDKEVKGKLPAPYSDQLVEDILAEKKCICGREVRHGTPEEESIKSLLEYANTSELNKRINAVRYLITDIREKADKFVPTLIDLRQQVEAADLKIAETASDIDDISEKIRYTDEAEVQRLENERDELRKRYTRLISDKAVIDSSLQTQNRSLQDYKTQYEIASRKLNISKKLLKDISKINKIKSYIEEKSKAREEQTLKVLTAELNATLNKYLTKHFTAVIDPASYKVTLVDDQGQAVSGDSTGEGQILKFAFISMIVAICAKRTKEKIDFISEPTVAPLVLDAPLSTLDESYRSSVVKSLAENVEQLVLMGSSSAWSIGVEEALKGCIGKEYLIVSRARGERGDRPIKSLPIKGRVYELNEYGHDKYDSYFKEIPV
jgi:DNA sulfur modification protein DndD